MPSTRTGTFDPQPNARARGRCGRGRPRRARVESARRCDRSAPRAGRASPCPRGTARRNPARRARCACTACETGPQSGSSRSCAGASGSRSPCAPPAGRMGGTRSPGHYTGRVAMGERAARMRHACAAGTRSPACGEVLSTHNSSATRLSQVAFYLQFIRRRQPLSNRRCTMLFTKSCARCRGDVTIVFDVDESYFQCVQCGYMSYQRPSAVTVPSAPRRHAVGADAPRSSIRRAVGSAHGRQPGARRNRRATPARGR